MKQETPPTFLQSARHPLAVVMFAVVAVHALALLVIHPAVAVSRIGTALMPICAAACCLWRSTKLPPRERAAWWWVAAALLLWSAGQIVEVWIGASPAASSLVVDKSDLLYLIAAFPLLFAVSSTSETEPVRGVLSLNVFQALLATVLVWVRLFRMPMAPAVAQTVLMRIYAAECILLVIAATMRIVSWATLEERRRMRMICAVLWIYLPIELGMDYATGRWHLQQGTLLDLLWSVPFFYAGWHTLNMSMEEDTAAARRRARSLGSRTGVLLLQSLCPMLLTLGVFALAVSILDRHPILSAISVVLLFLVQGLLYAVIHVNYLKEHVLLQKHEQELRTANAGLERLSLLDPLTGIANRRQFTAAFDAEWKRSVRRQEQLAVLMIDVDFFKGVNDQHGHSYGDECLVHIAQTLRTGLKRGADMVARYGGEEFIVMLPDTDLDGGAGVAERLQEAISELAMPNNASPFDRKITVSIGVAAAPSLSEDAGNELIEQADRALYTAKRAGRNRIEKYQYSALKEASTPAAGTVEVKIP
jgi:diguanylate cyclase (GGDEF)-like protein